MCKGRHDRHFQIETSSPFRRTDAMDRQPLFAWGGRERERGLREQRGEGEGCKRESRGSTRPCKGPRGGREGRREGNLIDGLKREVLTREGNE